MFRNWNHFRPFIFSSFYTSSSQNFKVYQPFNRFPSFGKSYSHFAHHAPRLFSFSKIFLGTSGALMALMTFKVNQLIEWSKDSFSDVISLAITSVNDVFSFGDRFIDWLPTGTWTPATKAKSKNSAQGNSDPFLPSTTSPSLQKSFLSSTPSNDEFSPLIRQLLEIQDILQSHGLEDRLSLPSVVVLGGQSAGKTSVLEALVGYSFLPKGGAAMVTRRPLHLRLVHDPTASKPYAIFGPSKDPSKSAEFTSGDPTKANIGPLYDMGHVEAMLRALNASVDEVIGIDETPIYLSIHASNLPNLSLVDLPGFIQVSSRLQSPQLRERIQKLANRYTSQSNVLLAVCPADIDLANSEALKAAKEVDPEGQRTIGVLSKLDLISSNPEQALATLSLEASEYPLSLGYVGLWAISSEAAGKNNAISPVPQGGISLLRNRLVGALESAMLNRIQALHTGVCDELSEVELGIRVQFDDDRRVSPDAYLAKILSTTTEKVESLSSTTLSRKALEQSLLESMRSGTASSSLDGSVAERINSKSSQRHGNNSLASEISILTRSHIGRSAASVIKSTIINHIETLSKEDEVFKLHPSLGTAAKAACDNILASKLPFLTLSIEASVKPFRRGTDFSFQEWLSVKDTLIRSLKGALVTTDVRISSLANEVGGSRRLRSAVAALNNRSFPTKTPHSEILQPSYMVEYATEASALFSQKESLERRISFLEKSPACNIVPNLGTPENNSSWFGGSWWLSSTITPSLSKNRNELLDEAKLKSTSGCPDVYLNLLAERLANTAALYLHQEIAHSLLGAFGEQLTAAIIKAPSEAMTYNDGRISKASTTDHSATSPGKWSIPTSIVPGSYAFSTTALLFAHENPELSNQLKMQSRRDALAEVRDRLSYFLLSQSQGFR